MDKVALREFLQKKYESPEAFLNNVIYPVFGKDNYDDSGSYHWLRKHPEDKIAADNSGILDLIVLGSIYVEGSQLDLFDITVASKRHLANSRVGIQQLIRRIISTHSGAFMIFHYQTSERWDWRFTFCHKGASQLDTSDSKRYTFLLGPGQSCRTAADNFCMLGEKIATDGEFEMDDIIKAFDVEALSKEFFDKYKVQYEKFVNYMANASNGMREYFIDTDFNTEGMTDKEICSRQEKPLRDYVKKLLGRVVFLHFIQKKGWLGVEPGKDWGDGDTDFMLNLFEKATDSQKANFLDEVLEPIFEHALNTDRSDKDDLFDTGIVALPNKGILKIPYLNGGLFEREASDEPDSRFPAEYFQSLLTFLSQYNFTIDENDPNDAQVGIDPEMLGRIFENLLEDNKERGTYYTPKPVVQYMCKEALIEYLQRDYVNEPPLKESIRLFVSTYDAQHIDIVDIKDDINDKLKNVKICDPAIGSGAFPIGLLRELYLCRTAIDGTDRTVSASIKKSIIQENIYGVDIEKGAVDIARLRFWLSLVLDETSPHALPNLDFKIMQGDSLNEEFEGINLSCLVSKGITAQIFEPERDLFGNIVDKQLNITFAKSDGFEDFQKNIESLYSVTDRIKKKKILLDVEKYVLESIAYNIELKRNVNQRAVEELTGNAQNARQKQELTKAQTEVERLSAVLAKVEEMHVPNNHFFLWHTYFHDVLEKGGFDIVIGNPPYVEAKKLKGIASRLKDYDVYSGTADFSIYFLEQGLKLCKDGGCLYFITTNKFFNTGYGKKVRRMILERNVSHIVNFEQVEVFEDILVSSVILGISNISAISDNSIPFKQYYKLNNKEFRSQFSGVITDYDAYPQSALDENEWSFSDADQLLLKQKIEKGHELLGNVEGVAIYRGVTTGYNPAFIITNEQRDSLIAEDSNNADVIKNMLQGRNVRKWYYNESDENLLQTGYDLDIQSKYPIIYKHLFQFYQPMVERSDQGRNWWNLRACQYYGEFEKEEKIIWGLTADKWAYTLDDKQHYLPSNGYILTSLTVPVKYILGILNSDLLKYYFSFIGVMTAGGAYTLKAATISSLPFCKTDNTRPIIDIVDTILQKKEKDHNADIASEELQLNELVYKLYGINKRERAIILANSILVSQVVAADVTNIQERPSGRDLTSKEYIINERPLYDWIIYNECININDVKEYIFESGCNDTVYLK